MAVVDRRSLELEAFTHEIEELRERFEGRRDEAALDTRNRGLAGASAVGELVLAQAVPAPHIT